MTMTVSMNSKIPPVSDVRKWNLGHEYFEKGEGALPLSHTLLPSKLAEEKSGSHFTNDRKVRRRHFYFSPEKFTRKAKTQFLSKKLMTALRFNGRQAINCELNFVFHWAFLFRRFT